MKNAIKISMHKIKKNPFKIKKEITKKKFNSEYIKRNKNKRDSAHASFWYRHF